MGSRTFMSNEIMNPEGTKAKPLTFPNRDNVTQQQLSSLLSIMQMSGQALIVPWGSPHEDPPKLTLEAKIAAENLFISVCEKIEEIIKDEGRWDFAIQQKLEDQFQKIYQLNLAALQASYDAETQRKQLADELSTPHARYRPALARTLDGFYVAFLGNLDDSDGAIFGMGGTPKEALEKFDAVFNGQISPMQAELVKTREKQLVDDENRLYDKKTMDSSRGQASFGAESSWKIPSKNSARDASNGGCGGAPIAKNSNFIQRIFRAFRKIFRP